LNKLQSETDGLLNLKILGYDIREEFNLKKQAVHQLGTFNSLSPQFK
jgi:hypothetical protein